MITVFIVIAKPGFAPLIVFAPKIMDLLLKSTKKWVLGAKPPRPQSINTHTTIITPMDLRCDKCGYKWDYGGMSFYATCPRCRHMNKIPAYKIQGKDAEATA